MSAYELSHGEALDVLRAVPDCCVDSVVMDPPYGLGFMGKDWDSFRRSHNPADVGRENVFGRASRTSPASYTETERDAFVAFMQPIAAELLRVLKPGGFVLSFGGTRTYHWLAWAVEGAGFEVRDTIEWMYGQGFPKSLDVAKAFDKAAGVEPLETRPATLGMANNPQWNALHNQLVMPEATTAEARRWGGWGTALKPAHEPILMARKPLEGTVIENVGKWGTGAINVDGCRVSTDESLGRLNHTTSLFVSGREGEDRADSKGLSDKASERTVFVDNSTGKGRFPANVILSHDERCVELGTRKVKGITGTAAGRMAGISSNVFGQYDGSERAGERTGFADADGSETVEEWACVPGCPVRMLDDQSSVKMHSAGKARKAKAGGDYEATSFNLGKNGARQMDRVGDSGGASRFFYQAKPAKSEKNAGCEHVEWFNPETGKVLKGNVHPTCKPVALMRYLCRLITPPGGIVLDPFMGSGTTGVAALAEGFNFAGIERDPRRPEDVPSFHIARARIEHAARKLAEQETAGGTP